MKRLFLYALPIAFLLFLTAHSADAQVTQKSFSTSTYNYEKEVKEGVEYIYNLEFAKAEQHFNAIIAKDAASPVGHFFIGMVMWWRILLDIENIDNDARFMRQMDKVIELSDERLERNSQDVEALFFKGGALGFRGRLLANRQNWLKAAADGKDALPLVNRARKIDPNNADILFGIGLYNYYAEAIPAQNPVLKPFVLLFPKGDKKLGIEQLEESAAKGRYSRTEALYFLLQIYYVYERDYTKAVSYAKQLYDKYPNNSFFYRYLGRAYAASGYWKDAESIFQKTLKGCEEKKPFHNEYVEREARYYLAMALMKDHKPADALDHFKLAESLSKKVDRTEVSAYQILIMLRIGMIYDLQGDHTTATQHYNKVLEMKDYQNAHGMAKTYLKQPYSG